MVEGSAGPSLLGQASCQAIVRRRSRGSRAEVAIDRARSVALSDRPTAPHILAEMSDAAITGAPAPIPGMGDFLCPRPRHGLARPGPGVRLRADRGPTPRTPPT